MACGGEEPRIFLFGWTGAAAVVSAVIAAVRVAQALLGSPDVGNETTVMSAASDTMPKATMACQGNCVSMTVVRRPIRKGNQHGCSELDRKQRKPKETKESWPVYLMDEVPTFTLRLLSGPKPNLPVFLSR